MTDLPPKELNLFRHVETPKTLPKGNERLIGDAQCSPAIAKDIERFGGSGTRLAGIAIQILGYSQFQAIQNEQKFVKHIHEVN